MNTLPIRKSSGEIPISLVDHGLAGSLNQFALILWEEKTNASGFLKYGAQMHATIKISIRQTFWKTFSAMPSSFQNYVKHKYATWAQPSSVVQNTPVEFIQNAQSITLLSSTAFRQKIQREMYSDSSIIFLLLEHEYSAKEILRFFLPFSLFIV